MDITKFQFDYIKKNYMVKGSYKINELGGSFKCIDLEGLKFTVDFFHGENPCYGEIKSAWISYSETNTVTI